MLQHPSFRCVVLAVMVVGVAVPVVFAHVVDVVVLVTVAAVVVVVDVVDVAVAVAAIVRQLRRESRAVRKFWI